MKVRVKINDITTGNVPPPLYPLPPGEGKCDFLRGFKPALVRRNVRFKTVLLNTTPRDSMKRTAKPGLGQGLENDEHTCPPDGRRGPV